MGTDDDNVRPLRDGLSATWWEDNVRRMEDSRYSQIRAAKEREQAETAANTVLVDRMDLVLAAALAMCEKQIHECDALDEDWSIRGQIKEQLRAALALEEFRINRKARSQA